MAEGAARRVALDEVLARRERLGEFVRLLAGGGVVAIPTETFYGLAANPRSPDGCARIFEIKGRDAGKALPVLAASSDDLAALGVDAPAAVVARMAVIWPAPLTVVFAVRAPLACTSGERSLAVRVPAHAGLRRLLARTGPLTGTSANRSGEPPAATPDAVAAALGGAIDLLIDGGATLGGLASTIVDAREDPPRLLRPGAFPWPEKR